MKEIVASIVFLVAMIYIGFYVLPTQNPVNCQKVFEIGTSGWHPDISRATIDKCIKQRDNIIKENNNGVRSKSS